MAEKCTHGGKRPGAGRPPSKTVRLRVTICNETVAILNRIAKGMGLVKRPGAPPFLGAAVDELAKNAKTQEPEYLKLAREAREISA